MLTPIPRKTEEPRHEDRSQEALKVFVGYDRREHDAYIVTVKSLLKRSTIPVCVTTLDASRLRDSGLLTRPVDSRGGVIWDLNSSAPCATEFSNSRFLTPLLAQDGWALFVDCDVVFLEDVAELMKLADPAYAVMVVKHQMRNVCGIKMDNQPQVAYARKNWSSVVLFNCNHQSNRRLSIDDINRRPGRDLHAFYWLADEEIGELPYEWNWLVGVQPKPEKPCIAHYTLGVPSMVESEHAELWMGEQ